MSFHQIVVWHDEQVARESALRRKPGLTLAFGSGQTYFVAQTGLDNGNFGLISRGPFMAKTPRLSAVFMAKTPRLSAVLLTLVFLWYRGAQAQESLEVLQKRAEKGSPEAQTVLGTMYRNGQGVRQDLGEAVRWFRQAAAQGYAEAENSLGFLYDYGGGVPIDHQEAARWYCKAAEQGYAEAQLNLGWLYDSGQGFPINHAERRRAGTARRPSRGMPTRHSTWE